VTGRLIPPAGIPLHVGVIVANVETLANIAAAAEGRPVTHKTLTVAGAVAEPLTLTVPLGVTLRDCLAAAGGSTVPDPVLAIGGMMMGEHTDDLDRPVTKTTGGVIVLAARPSRDEAQVQAGEGQNSIGKSACDQCRYCTEYCPRFLLGYAVEPHQVMRSLAFTATGKEHWNQWAALCCSCGLCTLYACPEELYPKEACDQSKAEMRKENIKWTGPPDIKVHPMRDGRRVPIKSLMRKLAISEYDHPAHWTAKTVEPSRVVLPLKQSAGTGNRPIVRAGESVRAGQAARLEIPDKTLSAIIHAPFDATSPKSPINTSSSPADMTEEIHRPHRTLQHRRRIRRGGCHAQVRRCAHPALALDLLGKIHGAHRRRSVSPWLPP
jgi:Na+-translocating ferredoxin:NAD+ oxidoreductase RnfC subunit